ncbi:translational GTPase TypA [Actinomarinicola tropica]|uniref:Large ribosomal subunit assembly factor BipA n=1 Tax=Actinomarinicola tropica TaxID=2789776 RepID=A0A5Q2RN51_9ACTN|nr:translational GTPase TypA [Actinomarinicola tropica]QGG95330.1 translational GTPase TypA [Actinomarinicola tropica]
MPPTSLRNVAIVAHVDHGKTTLVDALLKAAGTFRENEAVAERVLDSGDQERERGITILAKAASITWEGVRINLVDTPGHADFGGEVERALTMVDGVLLLVDAAEGPLPQTRYVLSKALAIGLPAVVVLNKVDRGDARPAEVLDEVYQLFMDLDADDHHIEFPVISAVAREGRSVVGLGMPGEDADLRPLLQTLIDTVPPPAGDPDAPLQAIVTNLDASDYLGRLAVGRVINGRLRKGDQVALCGEDDELVRRRLSQLLGVEGVSRVEVEERAAGDLFVLAGFPEVEIGDTLADAADPQPLPRLTVDEPVMRMTFGVNTSPLAGKEGKYLTSRHLRERLEREVLGNVSIRLAETDSPDIIEVAARGELQLAVLIESMRREGYELQVSRPEVLEREIDGRRHEPLEHAVIDVPDDFVGTVTQAVAPRKGRVSDLRPGDAGRTIITIEAPSRGLLGFRSLLLTATRGTALMHQHHEGWIPWVGELPTRSGGAMIADRSGTSTGYALDNLQQRGEMFIGPGETVYEGMIIGESARGDEMQVNVTREKQKTNIRTHASDDAIKLTPPRQLTLESCIEWIADDELVEVTPSNLRLRKRVLREQDRRRLGRS